ncbi:MAG: hypothetical protein ABSG67_04805 [Thermoguttaceae bacterium]
MERFFEVSGDFRGYLAAAPLKHFLGMESEGPSSYFRDQKVAAPLKHLCARKRVAFP